MFCLFFCFQVGKSSSKPEQLGGLSQEICKQYNRLADNARMAAMVTGNEDVSLYVFVVVVVVTVCLFLLSNVTNVNLILGLHLLSTYP